MQQCQAWRKKYPVVQPKHALPQAKANVYCFIDQAEQKPAGRLHYGGRQRICVCGWQPRLYHQAWTTVPDQFRHCLYGVRSSRCDRRVHCSGREELVCITGDGSLQMNLQELQTIIHHKLPIKLYVINNSGYHSIRQTQKNFFGEPLVGIGADSGDLSFPDLSKLANAYGFPYFQLWQQRGTGPNNPSSCRLRRSDDLRGVCNH